ncbi:hypothetical protein [Mucilaginibacter antarcticus]|uniref:Uncharacterized protein n=1 Tax=Mucilaginibacter antarcticus TaxID=1855725 RepID=A0ABW5XMX1_9SPHI
MGETSTLNELTNQNEVMKESVKENLEADELIFYHSLRPQLDLLQKNPQLQTISNILDYSKGLR